MDAADIASDYEERLRRHGIALARGEIPAGSPGDCERCGEPSPRLVGGLCVNCRDKLERFGGYGLGL